MFLTIKLFLKFLRLINSETAPSQLAAGLAFGLIVGVSPFFSLHNLVVFLIVCLFRVSFSMFFLSSAFFSIVAFAFDPLFDRLGYWLLVDLSAARPAWIWIASQPILPFFKLNNTIVVGSLALGIALFLPSFLLSIWAVRCYRDKWREKIKNSKAVKVLKATKLYGTFSGLFGKYQGLQDKWSRLS